MNYDLHNVKDSFELISRLEPDEVDVTITDPPYNAHVQNNMISGTAMKAFVQGGGGGSIPHKELPFAPLAQFSFAKDLVRATRRWVLVFCAVEDFGSYKEAVRVGTTKKQHMHWVRGGIWYKPNAQGQMTGDRPAASYEGIACMHSVSKKSWNGRGSYAYWRAEDESGLHFISNGTRGEKGRHPNQKPFRLCLELVAKFSNRGETVFDPFCGSGRIGEACILLGRQYVGLDLHPGAETDGIDWVKVTHGRLRRAEKVGYGCLSDEECLRLCSASKASELPRLPERVAAIARV